jgi:hypothetical protein
MQLTGRLQSKLYNLGDLWWINDEPMKTFQYHTAKVTVKTTENYENLNREPSLK